MARQSFALSSLLLAAIFAAGCSESCPPPPLASATIDETGGIIAIEDGNLAGTALAVAPNALTEPTTISIFDGIASLFPGELVIGPPIDFQDDQVTFAVTSTVQLVFEPALVPASVSTSDFVVKHRASTGVVTDITPDNVDPAGLVMADVDALGTYWIVVPDEMVSLDYFPLNDGDIYTYGDGTVLTIAHTTSEPNFEMRNIIKLTFTRIGRTDGIYLELDGTGGVLLAGQFFASNTQERFDSALQWLNDVEIVGTQHSGVSSFLGFSPFGSTIVRYQGLSQLTTEIIARTSVSTSVGTFPDTVQVDFTRDFTKPAIGTTTYRLWLARDVGPVRMEFGGTSGSVTGGTVGGQPIMGI